MDVTNLGVSMLKEQIKSWLDNHESAPSALSMVGSCCGQDLADHAYELPSEADADDERNQLIDSMTADQLNQLAALIIEISDEKLSENE